MRDSTSKGDPSPMGVMLRCRVVLRAHNERDELATAYTGGSVRAGMHLIFDEAVELEMSRVTLQYRAFGSGSPETHEIARRSLLSGPVEEGVEVCREYVFELPEQAPISYEGRYVKIQWALAVTVVGVDGRRVQQRFPLLVLPRPVEWEPVPPPELAADWDTLAHEILENGYASEMTVAGPDGETKQRIHVADPADAHHDSSDERP